MKIYSEIIVPLLELLIKPKTPVKVQTRKDKLKNKAASDYKSYNEYYKSGTLKLKSGKIPEAIDDFNSALSINSSFHQGYFNRGFAKLKLDDLSGAILDFSSSIEFSQRNAKAFFYRGISYYKAGEKNEATKDFFKAIEIDPSYKAYLKKKDSGKVKSENNISSPSSEDASEDIFSRTPSNSETEEDNKTNSGKVPETDASAPFPQDKSFTLKDEMLPSSIDKQGKDPMIVFAIMQYEEAFSKYEEGDKPGALEKFSEALKYHPKFSEAFADRGRLKSELGESNGAIKDYTNAVECDPKFAQAYFYRSKELFKLSRLRDSLVDCSRAIKFNPNYGQAYLLRSFIKKALGNNRSASEDLIKASHLGACNSEELLANGPLKSDS